MKIIKYYDYYFSQSRCRGKLGTVKLSHNLPGN